MMVLGGGSCALCICLGAAGMNEQKKQADLAKTSAATVQIGDFLGSYRTNEVGADNKYKGQWVVISGGRTGQIKKDILDKPYLTVGTSGSFEIPQVQCFLTDTAKAGTLKPGDAVTVRGRVDGLMMNVLVRECEIVQESPTPAEISQDKICAQLRAALGEGRCDEKRRLELMRDGSPWLRAGGMCLSTAAEYDGAKNGFLTAVKNGLGTLTLTMVESKNPLCFGFVVSADPVPNEMRSKIQGVFDTL